MNVCLCFRKSKGQCCRMKHGRHETAVAPAVKFWSFLTLAEHVRFIVILSPHKPSPVRMVF